MLYSDNILSCNEPNDKSMFGGVISEVKTRTLPPSIRGHQLSFHYICGKFMFGSKCVSCLCGHKNFQNQIPILLYLIAGGNSESSCKMSVDVEEKSATSYSKRTVWTLDDSFKTIGASNMQSSTWNHTTINLVPTETESNVIINLEYDYLNGGGVGLDNVVFSSSIKCDPR